MYKVGQLVTLVAFNPDDTPPDSSNFVIGSTYKICEYEPADHLSIRLDSGVDYWWFPSNCIKPIPTSAIRRP